MKSNLILLLLFLNFFLTLFVYIDVDGNYSVLKKLETTLPTLNSSAKHINLSYIRIPSVPLEEVSTTIPLLNGFYCSIGRGLLETIILKFKDGIVDVWNLDPMGTDVKTKIEESPDSFGRYTLGKEKVYVNLFDGRSDEFHHEVLLIKNLEKDKEGRSKVSSVVHGDQEMSLETCLNLKI